MKFTINNENLRDALHYVNNVIEKRFTYPILTNVLFEVDDEGMLNLRATDHDISLMATVQVDSITEAGSVTIPGKKCLDVLRAASSDSEIVVDVAAEKANLRIGHSSFKLATMPAAEFPEPPAVEAEAEFTIDTKDFVRLLQSAASSMGVGDVRPHLNGTLIELTSVHVRAVASDGMSMCICTDTNYSIDTTETIKALVPRKAVLELIRAYSGTEGELSIAIAANVFRVEGLGKTLVTNLIGSPFPAYMRVVPEASDAILRCDRDAFIRSLDQAATLSDQSQRIYIDVEAEQIKILATTEAGDRAEVQMPVEFSKESTKVAFKHDRLRRLVEAFECDEVLFHLPDPRDVVRIESDQQPELLFIVSPVKS